MKFINTLLYFFLLIKIIFSGSVEEIILPSSKYNDYRYINSYKIPNNLMSFYSSGGEKYNHNLINAFDGDFNTYWGSVGKQGGKYINPTSSKQYDSLINSIIITFSKSVDINRMLYKAPYANSVNGAGYPIKLSIYCKRRDINGNLAEDDNDFLLVDQIVSEQTGNLVLFTFNKIEGCDQIKIEWNEMKENIYGFAYASEIILLYPENQYLDELLFNVYDLNDYTNLTINSEYKYIYIIDDLIEQIRDIYDSSDFLQRLYKRIESILNGELKYEPKREFTTDQSKKGNVIHQWGNTISYSKNVLKMSWGGTDRQCTGIYGFPNETINIYVDCEENDPLPSIRFSQFLGLYKNGWLSNPIRLKKGINTLIFPSFNLNNFKFPTNPGGPIYIENIFTSDQQSQNIRIYIEGGVVFPLFRKNDDEDEYKKSLINYISEYNKHKETYLNITELYSDHIMITVEATLAYEIYINQNKSPQANLLKWDERIEKFLIFDGIQLEENQPYYDIKNKYINIHLRYSQLYSNSVLAYATTEHIGLYVSYHLKDIIDSTNGIDRTIAHEIGHILDVKPRIISEQTNNVITGFSEYLDDEWHDSGDFPIASKAMIIDDVDILLRGCRVKNTSECNGLFYNYDSYRLGYVFWWWIEMLHKGYWGELDNLYRYNYSLISGLTQTEGFIYLTNKIVNLDMGYFFERLGFSMGTDKIFKVENAGMNYKSKMEKLIEENNIDTSIKKKIWYFDTKQYDFNPSEMGCFSDKNKYDIQIVSVVSYPYSKQLRYNITLPYIDCKGLLGFEIYEHDKLIDFTYKSFYLDENKYEENYIPKYHIIAFDRNLDQSLPSEYKIPQNLTKTNALKNNIKSFLKFFG